VSFSIPERAQTAWLELAAALAERWPAPCEDPATVDAWWAEGTSPASLKRIEEARYGCRRCPVAGECLTYALAADERYGVWEARHPTSVVPPGAELHAGLMGDGGCKDPSEHLAGHAQCAVGERAKPALLLRVFGLVGGLPECTHER